MFWLLACSSECAVDEKLSAEDSIHYSFARVMIVSDAVLLIIYLNLPTPKGSEYMGIHGALVEVTVYDLQGMQYCLSFTWPGLRRCLDHKICDLRCQDMYGCFDFMD